MDILQAYIGVVCTNKCGDVYLCVHLLVIADIQNLVIHELH